MNFRFAASVFVCTLFTLPACGLMQSTARVVDPVGPITVSTPPTVRTTATGVGTIHQSAYAEDSDGNSVGGHSTVSAAGITQTGHAGSISGHTEVSATGISSTIVDAETGETQTFNIGLPNVAAVGHVSAVVTTITTETGNYECGMSYDGHAALLESLRANPQATMVQIDAVKSAAAANWFTSDQAVAILYTIGYDLVREEAIAAMYPKICDPQNWFKVFNTIDNYAVRSDLQEKYK
jgi:hypothetical protein